MRRRRPGWIGWLLAIVLAASAVAPASAQLPSSGAASGSAGGDLGGTYPDPTVTGVAGSPFGSGVATALHATAGATGSFALQSALASYCLITGCTYTGTVGVVNLNATGIINPAAAFTPTAGSGAASVSGNLDRSTGLYRQQQFAGGHRGYSVDKHDGHQFWRFGCAEWGHHQRLVFRIMSGPRPQLRTNDDA